MLCSSRLGCPACSQRESALKYLEPPWCLFPVPGQTCKLLMTCGLEDLEEGWGLCSA